MPHTPTPPRIGQIVHYRSHGSGDGKYAPECRAAIVAGVAATGPSVVLQLAIINPTGFFFNESLQDETQTEGGTWHWECPAPRPNPNLKFEIDPDLVPGDEDMAQ